ncbi:hypothetical protein EHS25_004029 [Saitozyma podzolica]|uniref:Uncharacterized protein n=1 Tax=Saitozyma podzolica TaxID=1890683 RepID=A0A427YT68_9TREE|nr:hypothetical protein EHS25_004029 [Saitozyma podzolica]
MSLDHILSVQVQQFASLIRLPTEIARPLAPLPKTRFHLQGIHESDAPVYWNVIAESLLARGAEVTGGPLRIQTVSLGFVNYLVVLGEVCIGPLEREAWRLIGIPRLVELINLVDWQSFLFTVTVTLPARGILLQRFSPERGRMLKTAALELESLLSRLDRPECYAELLAIAQKSLPDGEMHRRKATSERGIGDSPAKTQGKIKFMRIRTSKVMREVESRAGEHVFHAAHLSQSSLIKTLSEGRLHKRSASPMVVDEPLAAEGAVMEGRESSPMEVDEDWEDQEDRKLKEYEEFQGLLNSCLRMLATITISSKRKADGYPFAMPAPKHRCV